MVPNDCNLCHVHMAVAYVATALSARAALAPRFSS